MADLKTNLLGFVMNSPVIGASGTVGYGVEYEERLERLAEITYPRPLEELLDAAFERYCQEVPWARDFQLEPKSVLRDMLESASDFKGYVQRYGIARSEGILLRYLADAFRVLDRTIPQSRRTEELDEEGRRSNMRTPAASCSSMDSSCALMILVVFI